MTDSAMPVALVHGALRSSVGLWPTAWWLRRRGFAATPFGYPTRRGGLDDHADRLASWLDDKVPQPAPTLGFVTHSMGGLVVRAYLARHGQRHAQTHRVVMLSPPNRGATLAEQNRDNPLMRLAYGDAAGELLPAAVQQKLGAPPEHARVLVLAGGRGDERGYNPKIEGDDDGVVAVAEMSLPGVQPRMVGGVHALLQWRPQVLEHAAAFLRGSADGEPAEATG